MIAHVKQSIYPVWERLPGLWWQWLGWRGLCRTDEVGGRKHPSCSQAGHKNTHIFRYLSLCDSNKQNKDISHINARCGWVELVFGQGWWRWWGWSWWGALVKEDAAVGKAIPPQVPEITNNATSSRTRLPGNLVLFTVTQSFVSDSAATLKFHQEETLSNMQHRQDFIFS